MSSEIELQIETRLIVNIGFSSMIICALTEKHYNETIVKNLHLIKAIEVVNDGAIYDTIIVKYDTKPAISICLDNHGNSIPDYFDLSNPKIKIIERESGSYI